MTVFAGFVVPSGVLVGPTISANVSTLEPPAAVGVQLASGAATSTSNGTPGPVVVASTEQAGFALPVFGSVWFGRLHIVPGVLDLGNLLNNQQRSIELWNGYFEAAALQQISQTGAATDGLTLNGPAPVVEFAPLQSRLYALEVLTEGPPSIEVLYTFTFDLQVLALVVTGTRAVLFPYPPEWQDGLAETWEYRTDVQRARDTTEQRFALRTHPRRQFEIRHLLRQATTFAGLVHLLGGWQGRLFAVPEWQDGTRLAVELPAGSTTVEITTTTLDFKEGGLVLLWTSPDSYEALDLESVESNGLTLGRATQQTWPTGTQVLPVVLADVGADQAFEQNAPAVARLGTRWQVVPQDVQGSGRFASVCSKVYLVDHATAYSAAAPGSPGYNVPNGPPFEPIGPGTSPWGELTVWQYRGLPAWPLELGSPMISPTRQGSSVRPVGLVDAETGIIERVLPTDGAEQLLDVGLTLTGRRKISQLFAWLELLRGKQKAFWMPTYLPGLVQAADAGAGETTLQFARCGYSQFQFQIAARRDLAFFDQEGRYYPRAVTSATATSTAELITLDRALGIASSPRSWKVICLFSKCRLESDQIRLVWRRRDMLTVALRVRTLIR